jgi:hypothetical protein
MKVNYKTFLKSSFQLNTAVIKDDIQNSKNKEYFKYSGTQVYIGRQGSGKTLSAVRDVTKLMEKYPKAILVTNLLITSIPVERVKLFTDMEGLAKLLVNVNNGIYGVIYLIDEIHTYFNALESKNIPMFVFTEISQQRKQRKLIIGTSQLFLRMAKPLREQADNIIMCKTLFNLITYHFVYDGYELKTDDEGLIITRPEKLTLFFHTRKLRNSYDTFQKVVSGKDQYENSSEVVQSRRNTSNTTQYRTKKLY